MTENKIYCEKKIKYRTRENIDCGGKYLIYPINLGEEKYLYFIGLISTTTDNVNYGICGAEKLILFFYFHSFQQFFSFILVYLDVIS